MKNTHTPGEWKIGKFSNKEIQATTVKGLTRIATTETKDMWHIGTDEAEANARLIAAAPDMLKSLVYCFDTFIADQYSEESEEYKTIQSAIDKATKN